MSWPQGAANLGHADALWQTWRGLGLLHVCISPGSRSAPLTVAAARHDGLQCHVILDERSAGFFALGLAKATGTPVALVCTSGTAAANYYPAICEASLSGVPLLVITADRPAELHQCGAAQTIRQSGMYAAAVREAFDLPVPEDDRFLSAYAGYALRAWNLATGQNGPVHLNVPFREALLPAHGEGHPKKHATKRLHIPKRHFIKRETDSLREILQQAKRPVLICDTQTISKETASRIRSWAEVHGVTVLADVTSGLRFGERASSVITAYDAILRSIPDDDAPPDLLLLAGRLPTSKKLQEWQSGLTARRLVLHDGHEWADPRHAATDVAAADWDAFLDVWGADGEVHRAPPPTDARFAYRERWLAMERAARAALQGALATADRASEASFAAALPDLSVDGGVLFLSNSMPIRDADFFCGPSEKDVRVFANRGANGIDGIVSTALGCAAGAGKPLLAVVGDLAFLHDSNGLACARASGVQGCIVVINNDGGAIFSHLPPQDHTDVFERYFTTPQQISIPLLAAAYGLPHLHATTTVAAVEAVRAARETKGLTIIELAVDRQINVTEHARLWQWVQQDLMVWKR